MAKKKNDPVKDGLKFQSAIKNEAKKLKKQGISEEAAVILATSTVVQNAKSRKRRNNAKSESSGGKKSVGQRLGLMKK